MGHKVRRENDVTYIEVPRHIFPDFTIKEKKPTYSDKHDYYYLHFCIEEKLLITEEANDNWEIKDWSDPSFISIKIDDGRIYILDRRKGWLPHAEATKLYSEMLAEKELLGD